MNSRNQENKSQSSRRSMLKGTIVGATGLAAAGGAASAAFFLSQEDKSSASAHYNANIDTIQQILNIAITAETLAVIFYTEVLNNANRLGLNNTARTDIKAALVEEAIHRQFLAKAGATPLTTRFSFPFGRNTFWQFDKFFKTQQQLEALFIAAYLVAGKEFAMLNRPDLVLVAAQIGGVEAEHRAVGRAIAGQAPANNRAFETALLRKVGDAPGVMKKAGFLGPNRDNSWDYSNSSMSMGGIMGMTTSSQDWS